MKNYSNKENTKTKYVTVSGINRSSRPEVLCKEGVLRNFPKFTGKYLCQSLFLIKLQALACEICEISKNTFSTEHLWWLLLNNEARTFLRRQCDLFVTGS